MRTKNPLITEIILVPNKGNIKDVSEKDNFFTLVCVSVMGNEEITVIEEDTKKTLKYFGLSPKHPKKSSSIR